MLRIGVDAMGGDYAPENVVLGAIEAHQQLPNEVQLYLLGDKDKITEICNREGCDPGDFFIIHCTDSIQMGEHPVRAYMKKPDSSIVVGFSMLARGDLDAFASAGSTGAMLTGCVSTLKQIRGVIRPCISAELPILSGGTLLLLDVGFNADCRADILNQFAILGNIYAKTMMGVAHPTVALLNIGGEEGKGNMVNREAYQVMSVASEYDFVGNLESNHLFRGGIADVVVTDGFTGNICLKQAESMYDVISARKIKDKFLERFDYEIYGGTPVLGVEAPVIIGHGASSPKAIANMIFQAEKSLSNGLTEKFNIFASH